MVDENVCHTNGKPKETTHTLEKLDALLLYQAKLNVKEKKNMIMNAVAYIATWLVLGVLYDGIFANRIHLWNVIIGVMLAWGCWIAIRIVKHVKHTVKPLAMKIRARFIRETKPDPVMQEYNRLKNMVADETV